MPLCAKIPLLLFRIETATFNKRFGKNSSDGGNTNNTFIETPTSTSYSSISSSSAKNNNGNGNDNDNDNDGNGDDDDNNNNDHTQHSSKTKKQKYNIIMVNRVGCESNKKGENM